MKKKGTRKNSNHCNLSTIALEWLNGELLGDGCLQAMSPYSSIIYYSSRFNEYINYISNILGSYGIKKGGIYKVNEIKWKEGYKYNSHSYIELKPIYDKWYPKGKKIVPKDLKLTPLVCRQWYIGDGYLNKEKKGRRAIILATCGFPIEDVQCLNEKLKYMGFISTVRPSNNTIRISVHSVLDFLHYIGECPVECYAYKWDYYNDRV